jgi:tetratricopeptide (TPR) repeat protein
MMQPLRRKLARGAVLVYLACGAACTTLGVAPSRPAPTNAPRPTPAPPTADLPGRPAPAPLPPSLPRSEPLPPPRSDVPAARPQSDASGASGVLLEQSRAQRAAGSVPAARASLERALRLDPNNPALWLELGELELQTGNNTQAATLARKAMTLAGRDTRLTSRAERLLRAAE